MKRRRYHRVFVDPQIWKIDILRAAESIEKRTCSNCRHWVSLSSPPDHERPDCDVLTDMLYPGYGDDSVAPPADFGCSRFEMKQP